MPIIDLQRRMRQLGEIRIGRVVDTGRVSQKTGKPILRPEKLNLFRFTSPSREILASVAELYGGEVQPWTPANGGPSEFEVYSKANRLPVLIPPNDAVSQWYELYAGSKCQRRCDGVTEHKRDRPCMCDPDNRECKITTRVNVMLRDVPALGQWLLISKGFYAAVTLPPAAELLAQAGGYVPGWLGMEEKLVQREDGPARFMVPTLDVEITPAALMAGQITGAAPAAVSGPERVAITGGRPDYVAEARSCKTAAEVLAVFTRAKGAGHDTPGLSATLKGIADKLPAPDQAGPKTSPTPAPVVEEVYEGEFVEDDDVDDLWFQIIAAAGQVGLNTAQVEAQFAEQNGGLHPGTANAARLREFLTALKAARS